MLSKGIRGLDQEQITLCTPRIAFHQPSGFLTLLVTHRRSVGDHKPIAIKSDTQIQEEDFAYLHPRGWRSARVLDVPCGVDAPIPATDTFWLDMPPRTLHEECEEMFTELKEDDKIFVRMDPDQIRSHESLPIERDRTRLEYVVEDGHECRMAMPAKFSEPDFMPDGPGPPPDAVNSRVDVRRYPAEPRRQDEELLELCRRVTNLPQWRHPPPQSVPVVTLDIKQLWLEKEIPERMTALDMMSLQRMRSGIMNPSVIPTGLHYQLGEGPQTKDRRTGT